MRTAAFAVIALALAQPAYAQAYRWVDQSGKVHYSDTPPPPSQAREVQKRAVSPSVIDTSQPSYATVQAARNYPVTLYTSVDCGEPCTKAREYLVKRGVPHSEVLIATPAQVEELKQLSGTNSVPVMLVGKIVTKGWEPSSYAAALDSAGYPQSAPRQAAEQTRKAEAEAKKADAAAEAKAKEEAAPPLGPYAPR